MHSSIESYGTRTLLELSVGKTHTIDVLIHLRTNDLEWWNSDLARHKKQLIELISKKILPVECRDEIESYHAIRTNSDNVNTQKKGVSRINISGAKRNIRVEQPSLTLKKKRKRVNKSQKKHVIEKEEVATQKTTKTFKSSLSLNASNKGPISTKKGQNPIMTAHKTTVITKEKEDTNKGRSINSGIDIKFAFGDDDIQVTYKVKPLKTTNSATLSYNNICETSDCDKKKHDDAAATSSAKGIKRLSSFRRLQKLPKQIVMWCYPFDPSNQTVEEGGGFPRPEMIPISSLFLNYGKSETSF